MEIIAGLIFSALVIILVCVFHKKETKVIEVIEEVKFKKPKKSTPKKKKKKMNNATYVKITLPNDLMNEDVFQGYVRWFYYYESLMNNGDTHKEDIEKIHVRYINLKSNLMVRITDRKDCYLSIKFGGDYDKFFAECKKLNDWLIADDIAQGKPNEWNEIVAFADSIEIKAIIEGKDLTFDDPNLNYEYRDQLCNAMFEDIRNNMNKNAVKLLYEAGLSREESDAVLSLIEGGISVEEAVDKVIKDKEFNEIFEEKDILNNDPITKDVDVDSLLEEWGLQ